jgi:hypothetical protein
MIARGTFGWLAMTGAALFAVLVSSCAKGGGGGIVPTPTPSGSALPSPGACATENPNAGGNLVVIDIGNQILPTMDPNYGAINGYGVDDLEYVGGPPTYSMVLNQWTPLAEATPTTSPITSNNIVQFTNVDAAADNHSAVAFPQASSFPSIPYTFPSAAASPSANTTIGSGTWSTGEIPSASLSGTYVQCFSQTFTLKPGTYYFGDYDDYNDALMRDVLVVGQP